MPLSIDQLTAFGIPADVVRAWRARGVEKLLPLQEKALADFGFLHGRNMLILAPTSSGKTLIGEMAALKHMARNRRVVFLVPTKALAEEKYRQFSDLYGPLGFRVLVSTRERPENDKLFIEGRYDLLVAVYEKLKAALIARPELLGSIGLVVADEIQTLGEAGRGATVDLLLTKIRKAPYKTQFIGLSAVLGQDAARLARWLRCDLLVDEARPLELREGVYDLSRGVFEYREINSRQSGEERLEDLPADGAPDEAEHSEDHRRGAVFHLARLLCVDRGEQLIVFVPTRYVSRNWAHRFARSFALPPAVRILDAIRRREDSWSRDLLLETLDRGVAFHNSDLAWDLRELVESHFNQGDIRVLFSTSTLGQGVNLGGRNVLHVPVMVETDRWTGRHVYSALSRGRFRNQGGRAARFSREARFGRSILLSLNPGESRRLMRDYVEGELEPLLPRIELDSLDGHILDLVASRVCHTRGDVAAYLGDTFSGLASWPSDSAPLLAQVDRNVADLKDKKLLRETAEGRLEVSGVGETAASTGLRISSVLRIAQWLREGPTAFPADPLEALLVLASTEDARDFPVGAGEAAKSPAMILEPIRERLSGYAGRENAILRSILWPEGGLTREDTADLRKALVLDAWISPEETRAIEEAHRLFSGTIANLASHFSWLAQAATSLARALALPETLVGALETLGERLALGCAAEALGLRSLRVRDLSRAAVQSLVREGFATRTALEEVPEEELARIVPLELARELKREIARQKAARQTVKASRSPRVEEEAISEKEDSPPPDRALSEPGDLSVSFGPQNPPRPDDFPSSPDPSAPSEVAGETAPVLVLDLRGAGRAFWDGVELRLSPLPFRLLRVLAESMPSGASNEQIDAQLWPDAKVEPQQIQATRTRLIKAIAIQTGLEKAQALIELRRGQGLVLDLPVERVKIIR